MKAKGEQYKFVCEYYHAQNYSAILPLPIFPIEIRVQHHTMLREKSAWMKTVYDKNVLRHAKIIYGILSKFLFIPRAQRVFFKCCATIVSFATSSSTHSMMSLIDRSHFQSQHPATNWRRLHLLSTVHSLYAQPHDHFLHHYWWLLLNILRNCADNYFKLLKVMPPPLSGQINCNRELLITLHSKGVFCFLLSHLWIKILQKSIVSSCVG